MTDCNGCGSCCDPVTLPWTQRQVQMTLPGSIMDAETRRWVLEDLTPISRREGLRRTPWLQREGAVVIAFMGDEVIVDAHSYYDCKHFDRETRRCTNYENRPQPCRDYPWYDGTPTPAAALPGWCSFNADVGREVTPVPVELLPTRRS